MIKSFGAALFALCIGATAASSQQLPPVEDGVPYGTWTQAAGIPPSMGADPLGAFRFLCWPSHLRYDDPIVNPGKDGGAAHLHQFFGNQTANAFSTYESLRSAGHSSCTGGPLNRSAYWQPAMLDIVTGQVIEPEYVTIYYKGLPTSNEIPRGLRMVFGYEHANPTSTTNHKPNWNCRTNNVIQGVTQFNTNLTDAIGGPGKCPPSVLKDGVTVSTSAAGVKFYGGNQPYSTDTLVDVQLTTHECWDGVNLDSPNHRSHMSKKVGGVCPSTHPVELQWFQLNPTFRVHQGEDPRNWRLASDIQHGLNLTPGSSFHGDWFGAWNDTAKAAWFSGCIQGHLSCASGNLGNGTGLKVPMDFYTFFPAKEIRRKPIPARPAKYQFLMDGTSGTFRFLEDGVQVSTGLSHTFSHYLCDEFVGYGQTCFIEGH
jgi:hypothetical protein